MNQQDTLTRDRRRVTKVSHRHFHAEASLVLTALFSLLLLTGLVVPAASAPVTWDLTGVTFADGGGATGWFTYDASMNSAFQVITDWSITATFGNSPSPPSSAENPASFTPAAPFAYSVWNQTYNQIGFMRAPGGSPGYFLGIQTSVPLDGASGPLTIVTNPLFSSYAFLVSSDYEWTTNIIAGQLTTSVPEPISLLILGSGLVGLVGFRRKFRK